VGPPEEQQLVEEYSAYSKKRHRIVGVRLKIELSI